MIKEDGYIYNLHLGFYSHSHLGFTSILIQVLFSFFSKDLLEANLLDVTIKDKDLV